jgi:hypothetical protein
MQDVVAVLDAVDRHARCSASAQEGLLRCF